MKLGLNLVAEVRVPWLTRHGHLAPAVHGRLPESTLKALGGIFDILDGDPIALAAKTRGGMRADFLLLPAEVEVEYDEVQHFTTSRLATFDFYPPDAELAFDVAEYRRITEEWYARGDRGFAHKTAAEFPGPAGRQRQRAYFDAFRDLAAPHFGNGPILRIAAPENDYPAAAKALQGMVAALHL